MRRSRQTEPVPFVLSSLNLPPNMTGSSRLLPQPGSGAGRTVRDELANRFVEGFQPTLDVVQGGLVSVPGTSRRSANTELCHMRNVNAMPQFP